MNILLVNDSSAGAAAAAHAITAHLPMASLHRLSDEKAFLQIAALEGYAAVVLDWDTGWTSGETLLRSLTNLADPACPIVVLASSSREAPLVARALGAAACLENSPSGYAELGPVLQALIQVTGRDLVPQLLGELG